MRGFTLVELVVSVGLFALVMLVATGAYFSLISLDRRARATNQVVSNLSFAMDTMMRGIRTGTNFQCTHGTIADVDGNSNDGTCDAFSYSDTILNTKVSYILKANKTIGRCEGVAPGTCTDVNASSLTDSTITIQKLSFYVRGAGSLSASASASNQVQEAHVTFVVSGVMPGGSCGSVIADTQRNMSGANACPPIPFTLQQASTQRLIDY